MSQVAKNRTDLLPHYSRFIATLSKYMPDIGAEVVSLVNMLSPAWFLFKSLNLHQLDEEFRYLQRKRNVTKELAEVRLKACHNTFTMTLRNLSLC